MTTATQQLSVRRWVLVFLAALVAVLATILSSATASAATTGAAETRVRASAIAVDVLGEPPEHIAAGQRLGEEPAGVVLVPATGVAANAGAGAGDDVTRLYRAVEPDELADIMGTGVYRTPAGGAEGKYFFPTQAQAENFASMMSKGGRGPYCITSGCIPTSALQNVDRISPAGEGTAYFVPREVLPYFNNIIIHGPQ